MAESAEERAQQVSQAFFTASLAAADAAVAGTTDSPARRSVDFVWWWSLWSTLRCAGVGLVSRAFVLVASSV